VDTQTAAVDKETVMAGEMHLRLTATGDYVPNTLPGEIWECNVNLALVFGTVDAIGTLPSNWSPSALPVARTETDWTITGNWHVPGPIAGSFQPDDYLNDQAAPAWTDFLAASYCSNQVRLRSLKLSPIIGPSGKVEPAPPYAQGTPMTLEWTSAYPTGGGSSTQLPPQDSIAVSWQTQQVGAHGKGRIFLPSATSAALSGAHVATTPQSDITAAGVAFLEALSYSATSPYDINVRPIVTGKPWAKYGVISQVRVGSIVDTQRRRRNRLTEVYTSAPVTY
jgi:hypothetical protein